MTYNVLSGMLSLYATTSKMPSTNVFVNNVQCHLVAICCTVPRAIAGP